jgi:hypothetical protein
MPQYGVKLGKRMFDQRKSLADLTVTPFAGCLCPASCRARRGWSPGSNGHAAGTTKWFRPRMAHGDGGGIGVTGFVNVVGKANVRVHRRAYARGEAAINRGLTRQPPAASGCGCRRTPR